MGMLEISPLARLNMVATDAVQAGDQFRIARLYADEMHVVLCCYMRQSMWYETVK